MSKELTKSYEELINKYKSDELEEVLNRGFVFQYDEDEQNADLLFIGINPSYTEKHEKGQTYAGSYPRSVDRSYFKPFNLINDELKNSKTNYNGVWTHIDLLVFRETNQKYVDELIKNPRGCEFIMEQLIIAKQRLIEISPKVVIVNNTKARELMGKNQFIHDEKEYGVWMGLTFEFDDEFGVHKVTNVPELKETSFLFSSMLSGQRALDLGSRERMIWQVKKIFEMV